MAFTGIGATSALSLQAIVDMRKQLDDLQRQLGTGKKSDSYAGLGLDRGLTVGLRSHLSAIAGYQQHDHPGRRAARPGADRADAVRQRRRRRPRSTVLQSQYALHGGTQTQDQNERQGHARFAARPAQHARPTGAICFPAAASIRPPVEIRRPHPQRRWRPAGLKQIIDERRQADLGASGLGRLVIGAPTADCDVARPRMRSRRSASSSPASPRRSPARP